MTTPVPPISRPASFFTTCDTCGGSVALCGRPRPHKKIDRTDIGRGYMCLACQDAEGLEPRWAE